MSRVHDHDLLVAQLSRYLDPTVQPFAVAELARKLRRAGTTLQRLAEAQCNGDWPADNGKRKVTACFACESLWTPSVLKASRELDAKHILVRGEHGRYCPDCRTQARVRALLKEYSLAPYFQGDPRGPVLSVVKIDTPRADLESGRERGIYVS